MYHAYRWFKTRDLFSESYSLPQAVLSVNIVGARLQVGNIYSQMVMGNLVHTSTVMVSRARLAKVHGFNEELRTSGEDYDFHLRTCREGPVGFVDIASIQYQIGMADRLTAPAYRVHAALNCIATVLPALRNDRARILLKRAMIRTRLAEVHQWAGDALLESGQAKWARKHLLKSLWYGPLQPRVFALLLRATLPNYAGSALRRWWRWLKGNSLVQVTGFHRRGTK
jgi:hypothetical protein